MGIGSEADIPRSLPKAQGAGGPAAGLKPWPSTNPAAQPGWAPGRRPGLRGHREGTGLSARASGTPSGGVALRSEADPSTA
jgi:hypothetical protein